LIFTFQDSLSPWPRLWRFSAVAWIASSQSSLHRTSAPSTRYCVLNCRYNGFGFAFGDNRLVGPIVISFNFRKALTSGRLDFTPTVLPVPKTRSSTDVKSKPPSPRLSTVSPCSLPRLKFSGDDTNSGRVLSRRVLKMRRHDAIPSLTVACFVRQGICSNE